MGAKCHVINHSPICNCPSGFTGNAFAHCHPIRKKYNIFLTSITFKFINNDILYL